MLAKKMKFTELERNKKNNYWLRLTGEYFLKNANIHKLARPNKIDPRALRDLTNELSNTVAIVAGKSWSTAESEEIGKQQEMWHHLLKGEASFYHVPSNKLSTDTLKNKRDY